MKVMNTDDLDKAIETEITIGLMSTIYRASGFHYDCESKEWIHYPSEKVIPLPDVGAGEMNLKHILGFIIDFHYHNGRREGEKWQKEKMEEIDPGKVIHIEPEMRKEYPL